MLRMMAFFSRRPGMSYGEFWQHWANHHGRLSRELPNVRRYVLRYVQHHLTPDVITPGAARYERDGVVEDCFESLERHKLGMLEPEIVEYGSHTSAGDLFLDKSLPRITMCVDPVALIGELDLPADFEHLEVVSFTREAAKCKVLRFLKRRPGATTEEFDAYWRDVAGPLLVETPELSRHMVRYVQHHLFPAGENSPGATNLPYDGISELWFETFAEFQAFWDEPAMKVVAEDERRYLDVSGPPVSMFDNQCVQVDQLFSAHRIFSTA